MHTPHLRTNTLQPVLAQQFHFFIIKSKGLLVGAAADVQVRLVYILGRAEQSFLQHQEQTVARLTRSTGLHSVVDTLHCLADVGQFVLSCLH